MTASLHERIQLSPWQDLNPQLREGQVILSQWLQPFGHRRHKIHNWRMFFLDRCVCTVYLNPHSVIESNIFCITSSISPDNIIYKRKNISFSGLNCSQCTFNNSIISLTINFAIPLQCRKTLIESLPAFSYEMKKKLWK